MATVPPQKQLELGSWSRNFATKIVLTPTIFGLTASQATSFEALTNDFTARLLTATTPTTRTKGTVAAKNVSMSALQARASQLVRIITATPTVTPEQRIDLGLNVKDPIPTPVPPPFSRPLLRLTPEGTLFLVDEYDPSRRSRPVGTRGALVFTKLAAPSDPPPAGIEQTSFAVIATRGRVDLPLPAGADSKKLYAMARWFNERGELGPVSEMVATTIAA